MSEEFSDLTKCMSKLLDKKTKQSTGFFATPNSIISELLSHIIKLENPANFNRILEPSAGTLAFVQWMDKSALWPKNHPCIIDAVEKSTILYNSIKDVKVDNFALNIINEDFIKYNVDMEIKYDLIIANPPYLIISKDSIPKEYIEYMVGRANLYCLFILHSLKMLKSNGFLAFIIPKSFMNSLYYSKIRNYLMTQGDILHILDFESDSEKYQYIDTKQATIGFIFQKKTPSAESKYALKIGDSNDYIFTTDLNAMRQYLENTTTISKLGLKVKTGNIVWNQHKPKLTDDSTKPILIYNSNITSDNKILPRVFSNEEKKQYIKGIVDSYKQPAILVNRGNGNTAYKLTFSEVNLNSPPINYFIENHLNVVYAPEDSQKSRELLNLVLNSLKNKKTIEFINMFCGNGGLSKTELETMLPIWI